MFSLEIKKLTKIIFLVFTSVGVGRSEDVLRFTLSSLVPITRIEFNHCRTYAMALTAEFLGEGVEAFRLDSMFFGFTAAHMRKAIAAPGGFGARIFFLELDFKFCIEYRMEKSVEFLWGKAAVARAGFPRACTIRISFEQLLSGHLK